jgi:hypothetical protein
MRFEIDSVTTSLPWFSVHWKHKKPDRKIAQALIAFLEDRRVLYGRRFPGDEMECVNSVFAIRKFLGSQLLNEEMSAELGSTLKSMQAACRRFISEAGRNGCNFRDHHRSQHSTDSFSLALGQLQASMGFYIVTLAAQYRIPVHEDLEAILPKARESDLTSVTSECCWPTLELGERTSATPECSLDPSARGDPKGAGGRRPPT